MAVCGRELAVTETLLVGIEEKKKSKCKKKGDLGLEIFRKHYAGKVNDVICWPLE